MHPPEPTKKGPREKNFLTEQTRDSGTSHHQRGRGQPDLPRLRRGPACAISGLSQDVRRDGRRGGAPPQPAVRPLQAEIRRLLPADPPPGRQGLRPPQATLARTPPRL